MKKNILMPIAATLLMALAAYGETPATMTSGKMPLGSIYSTSGQKELKAADSGAYLEADKSPAVVAFAWAKDFKTITKENLIPATGTKEKPQTLPAPKEARATLWAVVYFGSTGSSPMQFIIDSAEWTKTTELKLTFERPPAGGVMTMDLKPYVAWVPLKISPGDYTLQLASGDKIEAEQKWTIAASKQADAKVTIPSTEQINVKITVPDDQQKPGGGR